MRSLSGLPAIDLNAALEPLRGGVKREGGNRSGYSLEDLLAGFGLFPAGRDRKRSSFTYLFLPALESN